MVNEIGIIACVNNKRGIGMNGKLLYHIPDDIKRFKDITMGFPIVMGRKTFESLPNGPLKGRENIVISRTKKNTDDIVVFDNVGSVLEYALNKNFEKIFFIGGAEIYKTIMDLRWNTTIYLTVVDDDKDADTYFPEFDETEWNLIQDENKQTEDGLKYSFKKYERKV